MTQPNWENVDVPAGAFYSWGNEVGQSIVGRLASHSPDGGSDYDNNPCPYLELELTQPTTSIVSSKGVRTDYAPGDIVQVTCGTSSLKKVYKQLEREGKLVTNSYLQLVLSQLLPTGKGNPAKIIQPSWAPPVEPVMQEVSTAPAAQPAAATMQQPVQQAAPAGPQKPANMDQAIWDQMPAAAKAAVAASAAG